MLEAVILSINFWYKHSIHFQFTPEQNFSFILLMNLLTTSYIYE